MFLSQKKLKKLILKHAIRIEPFISENLKLASYTFTLDDKVHILQAAGTIDPTQKIQIVEMVIPNNGFELKPGHFGLFFTREKVTLNNKYVCLLSTRSTIAQLGLDVAQSSIFAEPNTNNKFVLEIVNNGPFPIKLYPGIKIVKGIFSRLE